MWVLFFSARWTYLLCFSFSCCHLLWPAARANLTGVSHLVSELFLWAGYPKAAESHKNSAGPEGVSAPHCWQWHLLVPICSQKKPCFLPGWGTQTHRLQCLGFEGIVRLQMVLIDTDFAICGFILLPAPGGNIHVLTFCPKLCDK